MMNDTIVMIVNKKGDTMSIQLEHPTHIEMPENPATMECAVTAFHPESGRPVCYDLSGHYTAKNTSVTLTGSMSVSLQYENDQEDQEPGVPARIIFHWSAGLYKQCWNGYQYGIAFDPVTGEAYALRFLTGKQKLYWNLFIGYG
jgi:hypothetical protein